MSDWTKEQRAIAAGHLCDLAALDLRFRKDGRGTGRALEVAEQIRVLLLTQRVDPEGDYREGLIAAGLSPDGIDDAVAAILRGEHPPDSLPGKVNARVLHAQNAGSMNRDRPTQAPRDYGRQEAFVEVLTLLGCEVPK